mmetsp:Transcript_117970/g.333674  ORF Transcript_117970/g.333674 Transcript_117970/m.333674 type:complete len:331 (-) Transcript_117970:783-1775(-)
MAGRGRSLMAGTRAGRKKRAEARARGKGKTATALWCRRYWRYSRAKRALVSRAGSSAVKARTCTTSRTKVVPRSTCGARAPQATHCFSRYRPTPQRTSTVRWSCPATLSSRYATFTTSGWRVAGTTKAIGSQETRAKVRAKSLKVDRAEKISTTFSKCSTPMRNSRRRGNSLVPRAAISSTSRTRRGPRCSWWAMGMLENPCASRCMLIAPRLSIAPWKWPAISSRLYVASTRNGSTRTSQASPLTPASIKTIERVSARVTARASARVTARVTARARGRARGSRSARAIGSANAARASRRTASLDSRKRPTSRRSSQCFRPILASRRRGD